MNHEPTKPTTVVGFVGFGKSDIQRGIFAKDKKAVERGCRCQLCSSGMKRQGIHKLFKENKPEAKKLATMHNICFYKSLFDKIRKAIDSGKSSSWKN